MLTRIVRESPRFATFLSGLVIVSFLVALYSFQQAHTASCDSRNATLSVLRDVITIATTPEPGRHLSKEEKDGLTKFQAKVYQRIDEARC